MNMYINVENIFFILQVLGFSVTAQRKLKGPIKNFLSVIAEILLVILVNPKGLLNNILKK